MSDAKTLKMAAARAALVWVSSQETRERSVLGIGTGSTVDCLIELLGTEFAHLKSRYVGAISSSNRTTSGLQAIDFPVMELNDALKDGFNLPVYIDGADEIDASGAMIKGGGGALTREKIIAQAAGAFVCIADVSKKVDVLGRFPLPIEVIPMAQHLVSARLRALGGEPHLREGFVTDNGQVIIDVHGLKINNPQGFETLINQIPGVVTVGLFAHRGANLALLSSDQGLSQMAFA